MIFKTDFLQVDPSFQEFPAPELGLFDLRANRSLVGEYTRTFIPSHWHSELELFVLDSGHLHVDAGSETYELSVGDGCFINTGVLHTFRDLDPAAFSFRSFVFDPAIVSGLPGSIFDVKYVRPLLTGGIPFILLHPDLDAPYFSAFDDTFRACEYEPAGYEFTAREALSRILVYLKNKIANESLRAQTSVQEAHLKKMLSWMDRNIEKNIHIRDLAAAANVCPRECQRIFDKYLHCSPMEHLRRRRIFLAADLLAGTDEPITDIALRCGFASPSYFSSQFRLIIGQSPSDYRASASENA